ncbi:IclR family transcriptional regulator [Saccharopolyspora sp. HNM0983]|uniref:IclR family transcriptional regulator n=1 Tax=Saccharopolyspora montiporae TaxID=2781240 RepID=A0A929BBE7_9PSEU|nr:IclR family transcriptional regulator [Saccharopolyspora sp. HNM0983]MBE9375265.1 IclR family transcriptional regulator [Saccharopolyspora sp. HNM0983]
MSQSLERGLTVLGALGDGPQTLDGLATAAGVHKSTALRLLRTLEANRFVRREGAHHYRLGSALFDLANRALEDVDVRDAARGPIRELAENTGHTIHVAVQEGDEVVYVDKVDSRHAVRMYSRVGRHVPLHCTAVGKALVAECPPAVREQLAHRIEYPRMTASTVGSAPEFLAELDRVRQRGFAVDRGEHEDFIHCIAAPVRDGSGEVVAAVSLSVPQVLLDIDGLLALVDDLLRTTGQVSAELGGRHEPTNGEEDR